MGILNFVSSFMDCGDGQTCEECGREKDECYCDIAMPYDDWDDEEQDWKLEDDESEG